MHCFNAVFVLLGVLCWIMYGIKANPSEFVSYRLFGVRRTAAPVMIASSDGKICPKTRVEWFLCGHITWLDVLSGDTQLCSDCTDIFNARKHALKCDSLLNVFYTFQICYHGNIRTLLTIWYIKAGYFIQIPVYYWTEYIIGSFNPTWIGEKTFHFLVARIPWWRHQMKTFPRYWPFVRGIHRSPLYCLTSYPSNTTGLH